MTCPPGRHGAITPPIFDGFVGCVAVRRDDREPHKRFGAGHPDSMEHAARHVDEARRPRLHVGFFPDRERATALQHDQDLVRPRVLVRQVWLLARLQTKNHHTQGIRGHERLAPAAQAKLAFDLDQIHQRGVEGFVNRHVGHGTCPPVVMRLRG
jgi:hypothetical protein